MSWPRVQHARIMVEFDIVSAWEFGMGCYFHELTKCVPRAEVLRYYRRGVVKNGKKGTFYS